MGNKVVITFPYINIKNVIIMDEFEIYPFDTYDLSTELTSDEIGNLNVFTGSFRETFFKDGENPKQMTGIGILKYKGSIIRDASEVESIHDCLKILFLLLKLHVSHDFFNPGMNHIDIKTFNVFGFNVVNNTTSRFGNMGECKDLHTTIPENIGGLGNIKFFPITFCTNNIPVEFKMFSGGEKVFGVDSEIINLTEIYKGIVSDTDYYKKFLNIASVHFGLEQQNDLFFYYSIIPSIIEVLLQLDSYDIKKKEALEYGKVLDNLIINDNPKIETLIYTKRDGSEVKEELGLIARTIVSIYDLRNELLHEGKKTFSKLKINFRGVDLKIYDIFQLIFKYTILNDLVEKGIIKNSFYKVKIEGSILTTGNVGITYTSNNPLSMDEELDGLIRSSESDNDVENNKE